MPFYGLDDAEALPKLSEVLQALYLGGKALGKVAQKKRLSLILRERRFGGANA